MSTPGSQGGWPPPGQDWQQPGRGAAGAAGVQQASDTPYEQPYGQPYEQAYDQLYDPRATAPAGRAVALSGGEGAFPYRPQREPSDDLRSDEDGDPRTPGEPGDDDAQDPEAFDQSDAARLLEDEGEPESPTARSSSKGRPGAKPTKPGKPAKAGKSHKSAHADGPKKSHGGGKSAGARAKDSSDKQARAQGDEAPPTPGAEDGAALAVEGDVGPPEGLAEAEDLAIPDDLATGSASQRAAWRAIRILQRRLAATLERNAALLRHNARLIVLLKERDRRIFRADALIQRLRTQIIRLVENGPANQ